MSDNEGTLIRSEPELDVGWKVSRGAPELCLGTGSSGQLWAQRLRDVAEHPHIVTLLDALWFTHDKGLLHCDPKASECLALVPLTKNKIAVADRSQGKVLP